MDPQNSDTVQTYKVVKTYQGLLRLCHLGIALSCFVLLFSGLFVMLSEPGASRHLVSIFHIYAGYALAGTFLVRVLLFIFGDSHSKLKALVDIEGIKYVFKHNKLPPLKLGHNPVAGVAYLSVYSVLALMVLSGLGLAATDKSLGPLDSWIGDMPWLSWMYREPHEFGFYFIALFVIGHLIMLVWHEKSDGVPVASGMISGYQYLPINNEKENQNETI